MPVRQIQGASIVILGAFNPVILSPDWLLRNQLIGEADAASTKDFSSFLISRQVTNYETTAFAFQALEDRVTINSKGPVAPIIRDFAQGILQLLSHTPVSALGLNFEAHYRLENVDDYHRFGDALAPKNIWQELFPADQYQSGLQNLTIKIQEGSSRSSLTSSNERNLSIQPSSKIPNGVFFLVNNHYRIDQETNLPLTRAEQASSLLNLYWDKCFDDSQNLLDQLLEKVLPKQ